MVFVRKTEFSSSINVGLVWNIVIYFFVPLGGTAHKARSRIC